MTIQSIMTAFTEAVTPRKLNPVFEEYAKTNGGLNKSYLRKQLQELEDYLHPTERVLALYNHNLVLWAVTNTRLIEVQGSGYRAKVQSIQLSKITGSQKRTKSATTYMTSANKRITVTTGRDYKGARKFFNIIDEQIGAEDE